MRKFCSSLPCGVKYYLSDDCVRLKLTMSENEISGEMLTKLPFRVSQIAPLAKKASKRFLYS